MATRKASSMAIENEVIIGRIYKIYNIIDENIYIGGTTKPLVKRLGDHMYDYNAGTNMELYKHFSKIGLNQFRMKLLECKQVDNLKELRELEQKWIDRENPNNLLNSKRASKKQIIKELINKVFEIKLDNINE